MMNFRKMISLFLALCLVQALPVRALAETYYLEDGSVVVSTDETSQYVAQNGGEAQMQTTETIITQRDNSQATSNTITVDTSAQNAQTAEISIQDVNISTPGTGIEVGASDVVINVEGDKNQVTATGRPNVGYVSNAPVHVTSGDLTITGGADDALKVTIAPSVEGGYGQAAVIGTDSWDADLSGSITVSGDLTLTATGNTSGAAIGAGFDTNIEGGTISIQGGNITAESEVGIGSSKDINNGTIEISGGTVNATGKSTGIGALSNINNGSIRISGGDVTATGGYSTGDLGPGIGTGNKGGSIEISGGTVTAQGGTSPDGLHGAAGIGSGIGNPMGSSITISGGTVTAVGGPNAAGIGTGDGYGWGLDGNIVISGDAQVIAQAGEATQGYPPNAIGNGGNSKEITRYNGSVTITGNTQVTLTQDGTLLDDAIVDGSATVKQTSEDWQTVRDAILAEQNKPAPEGPAPILSAPQKDDPQEEAPQPTLWDTIMQQLNQAPEGSEVTIEVYDNPQIPRSILERARQRSITLIIQWDGGEDIRLAPDADIDLSGWFIPLKDL